MTKTLERVLAWVNRHRQEWGLKPLAQLPPGQIGNGRLCPLARALSNAEAVTVYGYYFERDGVSGECPIYIARFVARFDDGAYPELVL